MNIQESIEKIKNNHSTSLDLTSNEIGGEGARALAEALKKNSYVTSLDLTSDEREAIALISEALKENTRFQSMVEKQKEQQSQSGEIGQKR